MSNSSKCPHVVLRNGAYFCQLAETHAAAQDRKIIALETGLRAVGSVLRTERTTNRRLRKQIQQLQRQGSLISIT